MNGILFDSPTRQQLLPLAFTRPVGEIRMGAFTNTERWKALMPGNYSWLTDGYLQDKYPVSIADENTFINATFLPDVALADRIDLLQMGETLFSDGELLAVKLDRKQAGQFTELDYLKLGLKKDLQLQVHSIRFPEDIFSLNAWAISHDIASLSQGKQTAAVSSTNTILGESLFVEKGLSMEACTVNTTTGPVYIAEDATVMEGSHLRGPLYIGKNTVVKMGAKIYGASSIGPNCTVGGEIKNSVFFGNSNKGHDGYLGNSVIGEWCNLGAATNVSNMKNNYKTVKLWDYALQQMRDTQLAYCGTIMGDFSRTGIGSLLNTGTLIGVSANIVNSNFPPAFVPGFSWLVNGKADKYRIEEVLEAAKAMHLQKNAVFTEKDENILRAIHNFTG